MSVGEFLKEVGDKFSEFIELDKQAFEAGRDGDFKTALSLRQKQKEISEYAIDLLTNRQPPGLLDDHKQKFIPFNLDTFQKSLEQISKEIPQLEQRMTYGASSIPAISPSIQRSTFFEEEPLSPTDPTLTPGRQERFDWNDLDDVLAESAEEELKPSTIERKPTMATKEELLEEIGEAELAYATAKMNPDSSVEDIAQTEKTALKMHKNLIEQYKTEYGQEDPIIRKAEKFNTEKSQALEEKLVDLNKEAFEEYQEAITGWEAEKVGRTDLGEYIEALNNQKDWAESFLGNSLVPEAHAQTAIADLERVNKTLGVLETLQTLDATYGIPQEMVDPEAIEEFQEHLDKRQKYVDLATDYLSTEEPSRDHQFVNDLMEGANRDLRTLNGNIQASLMQSMGIDPEGPRFEDDKPSLSRSSSFSASPSTSPSEVGNRLDFKDLEPITYGNMSVTPRKYFTDSTVKKGGNTQRAMNNANTRQEQLVEKLNSAITRAKAYGDDGSIGKFMDAIDEHHENMNKIMEQRNSIKSSPSFYSQKKKEASIYFDRKRSNATSRIDSVKLEHPNAARRAEKTLKGTAKVAKTVKDVSLFAPKYAFSSKKREKVNNKVSTWHKNNKKNNMTYKVATRIGKWGAIGAASPLIVSYMMMRTKGRKQLADGIKDGYKATKEGIKDGYKATKEGIKDGYKATKKAGRKYVYKPVKGTLKAIGKGIEYGRLKQVSRNRRALKQVFRKQPNRLYNGAKNLLGREVGLSLRDSLKMKAAKALRSVSAKAAQGVSFVGGGNSVENIKKGDTGLNAYIAKKKAKQFETNQETAKKIIDRKGGKLLAKAKIEDEKERIQYDPSLTGLRNINRRLDAKTDLIFQKHYQPKLSDLPEFRHLPDSLKKGIKEDPDGVSLPKTEAGKQFWMAMVAKGELTSLNPASPFQPNSKDFQDLADALVREHGKTVDCVGEHKQGNLGAKPLSILTSEHKLEGQVKAIYTHTDGTVLCMKQLEASPPAARQARGDAFLATPEVAAQHGLEPGKGFQPIKVGKQKEIAAPAAEKRQSKAL